MTPSASLRVWTGIFIAFVDAPTKYHIHTPKSTLQNCFNYLFFQNEQINDQKNQSKVVLNRKSKQPKKKKNTAGIGSKIFSCSCKTEPKNLS